MEDTKQDIDTKVETEEEVKTKRCPKCERVLPLSDFNKCKSRKDGLDCWCKECKRAMNAQHYQSNKDAIAKKKADYYQSNKDAILKKIAEYRANNKDAILKKQAEYYSKNKEKKAEYRANNKKKIAEYQAEWRAKHPTYDAEYYSKNKEKKAEYDAERCDPQKNPLGWAKRIVKQYRRMDRDRFGDDSKTITAEWFLDNIAYQPCSHCGLTRFGSIGANRLDNTKGHTQDNVESCCFKCNCKENVRDQIERGLAWFQKRKKQSFKEFVEKHKAKNKNLS